jgi:hydroxymethylbilane synthase
MKLTIATRASKLALWQANYVKQLLLKQHPDLDIHLLEITTTGDKEQSRPLAEIGGKGLFIKELEQALLEGRADLAVHSMKDVPNDLHPELHIAAICEREDARDVFLSNDYVQLTDLPKGAHLGTSSVRRRAQLLALRPDLHITDLRGNVDTRLNKLLRREYDAIVLAAAGLKRLGLQAHIKEYFSFEKLLPSVAQGALGIETKKNNAKIAELLSSIDHHPTRLCIEAERLFTHHLQGDCYSPIGVVAQMQEKKIHLQGLVISHDGKIILRDEICGTISSDVGKQLAERLLKKGAKEILYARTSTNSNHPPIG